MALTGNTATLTLGGSSWDIVSIGPLDYSRPVLNQSVLATTTFELVGPGDLAEVGPIECEILYDPDDAPAIGGAAASMVITYKVPSGQSNGATETGSGFISAVSTGTVENNAYMRGSVTLQFAGGTTGIVHADSQA